ncbi:cell division protein FtsA [Patescibacteria group bacterium]|nr:cell division protein FtsA [Patescibacteria group bacterium]
MADEIITGLDIGSSMIRVAVCKIVPVEDGKIQLHVIGAVSSPSHGMHKGAVSSMEDAVSGISKAIERAERMTGVAMNTAWVALGGQSIAVQESRGAIAVARPEGEITEDDVERAVEAAKTVAIPSNYEILHTLPKSFAVDGQRGVKDPVGMSGVRLEVDAVIIEALSSHVKNLTKSVYRTGLDIDDVVYGSLATAEAVLTQRQRELGSCVVNMGAATTSVAVFEEGDLLHTAVLPFGGDHITNDLAIGLRTSIEIAEQVKLAYGHAVPDAIDRKQQFALADFGAATDEIVKRRFVAEVIEARLEEIFEAVDAELRKVDRSGMLPVGVVFTGGAMKLEGALEVAKRVLRLPCAMGVPLGITSVIDEAHDPAFATAIGLAIHGKDIREMSGKRRGLGFSLKFRSTTKVADTLKKWMQSLIP